MEIVAALPRGVARVGVFVNSPAGEVREIARRVQLDYVQIHGDEPPEYLAELDGLAIFRALRGSGSFALQAKNLIDFCTKGGQPQALLVDAFAPGQYGGTGQQADWPAIAKMRSMFSMPVILAGGLKPANVAAAIEAVRPAAVDTASGVESAAGIKSAERMAQFVAAARRAFAAAEPAN